MRQAAPATIATCTPPASHATTWPMCCWPRPRAWPPAPAAPAPRAARARPPRAGNRASPHPHHPGGIPTMPCNKAVSIVKAALTDEASAKLLTQDVLATVVGSYLSQQGYTDWDSDTSAARTYRVVRATDNGGVSISIQSDGLNATFHITAGGRQVSTSL